VSALFGLIVGFDGSPGRGRTARRYGSKFTRDLKEKRCGDAEVRGQQRALDYTLSAPFIAGIRHE